MSLFKGVEVLDFRRAPLPPYATMAIDTKWDVVVTLHPDKLFPYWFRLWEVTETTKYWLEMAHRCSVLDIMLHLEDTAYDPRPEKPLAIYQPKVVKWKQDNYPDGWGVQSAFLHYKERFKRARGKLPK